MLLGLVDIVAAGSAVPLQFERLAEKLGIPAGPPTIVFYTAVKRVLRELPDKAYADNNARVAIADAVQGALDAAIEVEEDIEDNDDEEHAP